jgi:DNA-binding MarR family transcriptional regulator
MWLDDERLPRTDEEKHSAYQTWLREESGKALAAAHRMLSPRAWEVFDFAARDLEGIFSPSEFDLFGFNSAANLRPYVKDLESAGLVAATQDDSDKRRKTIQVVAKGWLVYYARSQKMVT